MSVTRHFLAPNVHWRVISGHCIIMDLENDTYLDLPAGDFLSVLPFVTTARAVAPDSGEIPSHLSEIANELHEARILTTHPSSPNYNPKPELPKATDLVMRNGHSKGALRSLGMLPQFLSACAITEYYLRRFQMKKIATLISRRGHEPDPGKGQQFTDRLIRFTRAFHSLRPFYPHDYVCLFDSLALLNFLAHWRLHPHLVFGVTVDPFRAHCWVQDGTVVLCDSLSFSSRWFTQILAL